jgi:hypothetical protein
LVQLLVKILAENRKWSYILKRKDTRNEHLHSVIHLFHTLGGRWVDIKAGNFWISLWYDAYEKGGWGPGGCVFMSLFTEPYTKRDMTSV